MSRWPWPMSGPRRPRLMSWPRRFRPRSRRVCMFTSGRIPRQNRLHTWPWIKRGRAPRMSSPPGRRVWPRWSTLRLNIYPRRQKLSRNRSISLKGYIHGSHWPGWNLSCNVYIRNINTRSLSDRIRPASVAQLDAPSDWRPGGRGFNPRRGQQHSFVEIDHEIFSTVILSLPLIQEGQLSVSGERMCTILVNLLED